MRAADVVFREARAQRLEGGLELIEEVTDLATALACAEAVGAMKFACDSTLEYLKARKQFGVPIGTFQALQHRMVDMVIAYEQARSMACLACSKVDMAQDHKDRSHAISAAKIKIADSARHISQEAVQLHGGMGMSEELKISHTFRRLTVLAAQFGDADYHLARFAAL
jgi:alkylation response protein AidB-like acyl-CoA dehydrogenase